MKGNINKYRVVIIKISFFEFYLKKKFNKNIAKKLSKIVQKSEKLSKTLYVENLGLD